MIFEAVNSLLANLDATGRAQHGSSWEAKLKERVDTLSKEYRILRERDRELIDYGDIATQTAYAFRYIAGHASFISQLLQRARDSIGSPLFTKETLTVTSLGGGPGSELLGLIDYLENSDEPVAKVIYWVLEKEAAWEPLTQQVCDWASQRLEVELHFVQVDVSDTEGCEQWLLNDDDLVIMSYFISEVCETKDGAAVQASLKHFLGSMSDNALLLYNDNDALTFYTYLKWRVYSARKFTELLDVKEELSVTAPSLKGTMRKIHALTSAPPILTKKSLAKVYRRILR